MEKFPADFIKALATNPKAKATWKTLSPDERRDFADWADSAKEPKARNEWIEKATRVLAAGKRQP